MRERFIFVKSLCYLMPAKPSEIISPTIYTYWDSKEGFTCPLCSSKLRHELNDGGRKVTTMKGLLWVVTNYYICTNSECEMHKIFPAAYHSTLLRKQFSLDVWAKVIQHHFKYHLNYSTTKLEILNNEKLSKILNFIKENPGVHARNEKIGKELNITRTPFLKHIMTLERFKLIRSKKIGKSLHYFLVDVPEDYDKYKVIFANPLIPKLIEEIFKNEGIAISKIGENLDVYSGTIQYHMKKLKGLDLIKAIKNKQNQKMHLVNIELLKEYNEFFKEPNFSKLLQGL